MPGRITHICQVNFFVGRRLPPSWRVLDALTAISNRCIVEQQSLLRILARKADRTPVTNCGGIPIQRFCHDQS